MFVRQITIETMARFILDYETTLNQQTIELITDNCTASMISPYDISAQYCLADVIHFIDFHKSVNSALSSDGIYYDDITIENDLKYLNSLQLEGVNYIEICF